MKLAEISNLIRSKNAGPFVLTFDVMFARREDYERVRNAGVLSADSFARLFGLPADQVRFFDCENALALKFSIPRPVIQGDIGDSDMHGGQQFAPLMDLEIP
jgi:hypothetical protein